MWKMAFEISDNLIQASSSYAGPSVLDRTMKKCHIQYVPNRQRETLFPIVNRFVDLVPPFILMNFLHIIHWIKKGIFTKLLIMVKTM